MTISLSNSIAPEFQKEIAHELERIEQENSVRILFAIESGSRAWGFPSPDSDYDVRFVYVHEPDWYMSIIDKRDVIERPISDLLDIGGWELRKALKLLLKPNPVLLEWLSSPIRYRWEDAEVAELEALSNRVSSVSSCVYHYSSIAFSHFKRDIKDQDEVKLKRYFYTLRPAMALRYMRLNGARPPMNMQALMQGCDLSDDERGVIDAFIEKKQSVKELGLGPRHPVIDEIIATELEWADNYTHKKTKDNLWQDADNLFRKLVTNRKSK